MLNSAEQEIYPANKSQITNNCKFFLRNTAEHENFSANKYENANFITLGPVIGFADQKRTVYTW